MAKTFLHSFSLATGFAFHLTRDAEFRSMGGAIAVHSAPLLPSVAAVVVIDVVEGQTPYLLLNHIRRRLGHGRAQLHAVVPARPTEDLQVGGIRR